MSVSSRDSIWGSMLTSAYCFFFQHDVEKILVFYGYIQIWWEILQCLWPDLDTGSRLPICSTSGWNSSFGDCRRMSEPGVVKGFEQPFTIKNQNTQLKKRPLPVKPIMDKKNCPYGFPGVYISICLVASLLLLVFVLPSYNNLILLQIYRLQVQILAYKPPYTYYNQP
jgi:hypothetical protein